MIVSTLLALVLVAAVPVALLAAVVVMVLGHVVAGLAVFGGSVLAAVIAVTLAGMSGMRQLRRLFSGGQPGRAAEREPVRRRGRARRQRVRQRREA